ncbi:MAG: penicillin acylase family protein [Pirellula sp.]|nr:penicillin acylase family protein [Pirellula sp.]
MSRFRFFNKRLIKVLIILGLVLSIVTGGVGIWGYRQLSLSLPMLDGQLRVDGIQAEVSVERDALGIPTISATHRNDLAFATGFVHAQDRFFHMDLLRRNAAGELSELIGPALVDRDKSTRMHRFRAAAKRNLDSESPPTRQLLQSYADGVNAGLRSLRAAPFEYLLLGQSPAPWTPEDSLLVVFSMFLDLQGNQFESERQRGLLHELVPEQAFDFLVPRGGQLDAPILGEAFPSPVIPGPDVFDPRTVPKPDDKKEVAVANGYPALSHSEDQCTFDTPYAMGSNNWAVSGTHTKDGRALVANDMHLRIQVPHIWYRASFVLEDSSQQGVVNRITGVTLPGTPAMIVGSNGHVAWGFTNSEADWIDVVVVEPDPQDDQKYRTQNGPKAFEMIPEVIKVRGAKDVTLDVKTTEWGPVLGQDKSGRDLVCRWVAYDAEGINLKLKDLENCQTIESAMAIANQSGTPHQNFVVADANGRIGWTIMGRVPKRRGFDGFLPTSWADGDKGWRGYLTPDEYPRVIDPAAGRIWTANARVVSDDAYRILGDSGYDRGARQKQIRDALLQIEQATEADMLALQLDKRALLLDRWRGVLLSAMASEKGRELTSKSNARELVEKWDGNATADSVGYRIVWAFRNRVATEMGNFLSRIAKEHDDKFSLNRHRRIEESMWEILQQRPEHYLDPEFSDWDHFLVEQFKVVQQDIDKVGSVEKFTWGRVNTTSIQHPMSMAIPFVGAWIDMPKRELDGGWSDIPFIQAPAMGASQRMAVSPGKEVDGYMHMPCGQSGHPLSPHYSDSHEAWEKGHPTPFLPGASVNRLVLQPQ